MVVEAVFWFHPLVWWIGARLMEERERACDEEVLCLGKQPHVYAQGILNVCKFYAESPVACVSGVTGSDLKKRVGRIMRNHVGETLSTRRKFLLVAAGVAALSIPLVAGMLIAPPPSTQLQAASERVVGAGPLHFRYFFRDHDSPRAPATNVPLPSFEAASVKPANPNNPGPMGMRAGFMPLPGGRFIGRSVSLQMMINAAYQLKGPKQISNLPDWAASNRFDIEASANNMEGRLSTEQWALMLRSLLVDRFQLAVHHETRRLPIYSLELVRPGKPGPELHAASDNCTDTLSIPSSQGAASPSANVSCGGLRFAPSASGTIGWNLAGKNVTMSVLGATLANMNVADRAVLDRTGLDGTFDFSIQVAQPLIGPSGIPDFNVGPEVAAPDPSAPLSDLHRSAKLNSASSARTRNRAYRRARHRSCWGAFAKLTRSFLTYSQSVILAS